MDMSLSAALSADHFERDIHVAARGKRVAANLVMRFPDERGERVRAAHRAPSHTSPGKPGRGEARGHQAVPDVEVQRGVIHLDRAAVEMTAD
jgi:hypothetical protein